MFLCDLPVAANDIQGMEEIKDLAKGREVFILLEIAQKWEGISM